MKSGVKPVAGKARERTQKKLLTNEPDQNIKKSTRVYEAKTLKLLWGRAAGRCAMRDCRIDVFVNELGYDPIWNIGEMGHIAASSNDGPRGNPSLSPKARDSYENLILLCRNCHGKIDGLSVAYPAERLLQIKADHEAWVRTSLPERGRTTQKWKVIRLRSDIPCDYDTVGKALEPDQGSDEIEVCVSPQSQSWNQIQSQIAKAIETNLHIHIEDVPRVAAFPLAPVSACVFMGYAITNRINMKCFQYHRDESSWEWPVNVGPLTLPSFLETQSSSDTSAEVFFHFELTAHIDSSELRLQMDKAHSIYRCFVPTPSSAWLKGKEQLSELARIARNAFEEASAKYPKSKKWHLLYAGPAPGAVIVGQQLNPTMIPEVQLYEFQRPSHKSSILISPSDSHLNRWASQE